MQIITLTEQQFDDYAVNHRNKSFYQSSSYGKLMSNHGFNSHYIGFVDDKKELKAASLILYRKIFANYKFAYAPRGFLIDYSDSKLLVDFTTQLKKLLRKQQFIFIKIDPFVEYTERNKKGEPIIKENMQIIDHLKTLGYKHMTLNKNFETLKPRTNAVIKLDKSAETLFNSFDKSLRSKIRSAVRKGIVINKGTRENIEDIHHLIGKKHSRKLEYYYDYYDVFNKKDMIDIYFATINPNIYLNNARHFYDKELDTNSHLTEQLQNSKAKDNNKLLNKKMESDRILNIYKNQIIEGTKIMKNYKETDNIVAATIVIRYDKVLYFLIDGYNIKYKNFNPNHLLKWEIIKEYAKKGYYYINLNGISSDFTKNGKYAGINNFKLAFSSTITELIGEFDLPINHLIYHLYNKTRFIKNYINKIIKKSY